jgi:hypothetical protein
VQPQVAQVVVKIMQLLLCQFWLSVFGIPPIPSRQFGAECLHWVPPGSTLLCSGIHDRALLSSIFCPYISGNAFRGFENDFGRELHSLPAGHSLPVILRLSRDGISHDAISLN